MKINYNGKTYVLKPRFFIISIITIIMASSLLLGAVKSLYRNVPKETNWTYESWNNEVNSWEK